MTGPDREEVRREAFRSAAAAVDRFLDRVGDPVPEAIRDIGTAGWDRFRSELARVVDLNLEMVRNAFGLYGALIGPESLTPNHDATTLKLSPSMPGSEASGVLWLHNFDEDPTAVTDLTGSPLSGPDGRRIDQPTWTFIPASVSVPAGTAVPVLVGVEIPPGTDQGSYRAVLSTAGHPAEPIEVRVDVVSAEPVAHDSW